MVFGGFGVGFILSAVATPRVVTRLGMGYCACAFSMLGGVGILAVATAAARTGTGTFHVALLAAGTALVGFSGPLFNVPSVTLKLNVTDPDILGRVTATVKGVSQGALPLGALIGGWLSSATTPGAAFTSIAAASLTATLHLAFSPIRPLREIPTPSQQMPRAIVEAGRTTLETRHPHIAHRANGLYRLTQVRR